MEVSEVTQENSGDYPQEESKLCLLNEVWKEVMELLEDRQEVYGNSWLKEYIGDGYQNIDRKARGIKNLFSLGKYRELKAREELLELIGYAAMTYFKVSNNLEGEKLGQDRGI